MNADATYNPGDWVAVAGAASWLLADLSPIDPLVAQCWHLVRLGAAPEQVLDALLANGFSTTVSFVLVHVSPAGVRVVVRGRAAAFVLTTDATDAVRAEPGTTWNDRVLDPMMTELRLSASGDESDSQRSVIELPLTAGVTMASSIRVVTKDMITSVTAAPPPSWLTLPPPHEPLPVNYPAAGHDTVIRSNLLPAPAGQGSGPTVLAVACPSLHLSPPHAGDCRICGALLPAQTPFEAIRPVLGVLRLSTGDVVTLDRGVVLGRVPEAGGETDRPHLVRLASPGNDISRVHLEVVLDGWHVLLRDCNSTNGTTIALPGQEPVRIRPHDLQAIEPGTVVSLADEVSFQYEVTG